jgi:hypothetical protein
MLKTLFRISKLHWLRRVASRKSSTYPLLLQAEEVLALKEFVQHPGWPAYQSALESLILRDNNALLTEADPMRAAHLRGALQARLEDYTLPNTIVEKVDATHDRTSTKPDYGRHLGSPYFYQ